MNTITKVALLSAALTLPAISGVAYSHLQDNNSSGMMMGQQVEQMRGHMQENHALMEIIIAKEYAEKRNQMMQEHKQSMQRQMQGMNKMMSDELMSEAPSEKMGERMDVMSMRMNMIQMMEYQDLPK